MAASTVFHGNSDRRFASVCAPLSRIFFVIKYNRSLGRMNSEVEIFLSHIDNRDSLMAFQNDCVFGGRVLLFRVSIDLNNLLVF